MKEFNYENQAKNLPDSFAKGTDSNNYKILSVEKYAVDDFKNDLKAVFNSLDLNGKDENDKPYVYGKTLDLYGEMLNQPRGIATDAQYLILIRAKIMRSLSGGDYPSVIQAICSTFDCEPSQVYIKETDEPCTVEAVTIPLNVLNKVGLTKTQTIELIKTILPVGVKLVTTLLEGTFEFSSQTNEMSNTAGFGDLTDENVGGYFGDLVGDEAEKPLPI